MRLLSLICVIILLGGCSSESTSTLLPTSPPTKKIPPTTSTFEPTERIIPPTHTVAPTETAEVTVPPTSIPACIEILYEENAQVEIFSPQGIRVLVDVFDPDTLSKLASEDDILLTTHTHWDHVNTDFQASFPGQQLYVRSGTIEMGDIYILGIPSAHNAGDALLPEGGTNYIYLIITGSLRIVHFGDIGQEILTQEQLDLLGEVDLAITQLANPYSNMSAENLKGLKLVDQIEPRLVLPTHLNLDSASLAVAEWPGVFVNNTKVEICYSDLSDQTQILFMGQAATQFAERLGLREVNW